MVGTGFQQQVWQALLNIPAGHTRTYGGLANEMGNPDAVRAVARANALNPVSILVPCHRVIGSNGKLTGYAGGLDRKQWLLDHEAGMRITAS
jgi:methylated-DNA-[protein]-cysteine S-methyltransferase